MLRFALLFLVAVLAASATGLAQDNGQKAQKRVTPPPATPAQRDVGDLLDPLLKANDFDALARTYATLPLAQRMWWARDAMLKGGSVSLTIFYMRDLWAAGSATKEPDPQKDMRVTAGSFWLYAYRVMSLDGFRCADPSAVEARRNTLLTSFRPIFLHLKAQPETVRTLAIELSGKVEASTAGKREDDYWLCRGGLEEMTASLEQAGLANKTVGELTKDLPKKNAGPGEANLPGKSIELPKAKTFVPRFLPREQYAPKQAEARERLDKSLHDAFK